MKSNQIERKIKLQVLDFPEWKKNSSCYVFSVRPSNNNPDLGPPQWSLDSWYKVDYGNIKSTSLTVSMIKMRATCNMAHVYAVWLPNDLSDMIDEQDNPEEHMELIMKYKFKI